MDSRPMTFNADELDWLQRHMHAGRLWHMRLFRTLMGCNDVPVEDILEDTDAFYEMKWIADGKDRTWFIYIDPNVSEDLIGITTNYPYGGHGGAYTQEMIMFEDFASAVLRFCKWVHEGEYEDNGCLKKWEELVDMVDSLEADQLSK